MRRIFVLLVLIALVLLLSAKVDAALIIHGTDALGNQLIYDTDLNITWYDYSTSRADWWTQMDRASNLTVTIFGNTYDDWRLPSTVDGPIGYNITNSEMGHIYYTELGNQAEVGLTNSGVFQHLLINPYWSGTESSAYLDEKWSSIPTVAIRCRTLRRPPSTGLLFASEMSPLHLSPNPPPFFSSVQGLRESG